VARSVPLGAFPTAVRTELTITASRMAHLARSGRLRRAQTSPLDARERKKATALTRCREGDATVGRGSQAAIGGNASESSFVWQQACRPASPADTSSGAPPQLRTFAASGDRKSPSPR